MLSLWDQKQDKDTCFWHLCLTLFNIELEVLAREVKQENEKKRKVICILKEEQKLFLFIDHIFLY